MDENEYTELGFSPLVDGRFLGAKLLTPVRLFECGKCGAIVTEGRSIERHRGLHQLLLELRP